MTALNHSHHADVILDATGISKHFQGVVALDDVDFAVRAGQVHALVGENGAGKSTLIKILTGVYQADRGSIRLDGEFRTFGSARDAWRAGIATSYQELTLVPMLSVARNLALGAEPRNRHRLVDIDAMNRTAREVLDRLGLDIDVRRPVRSFGAGVQQMIAIVRAVSGDARVVILDEPTSSLEPREVEQLFAMIERLKADGVGLVFVAHNLDEVFEVSDRVTVLRDGRVVASDATSDTTQIEVVARMLGRDLTELREHGLTSFDRKPSAGGRVVLEAEGLSRSNTLSDVSLTVRAGDIVGLAGLLGSGRSETIRAVFGTQRVDAGRVAVDGRPVPTGSPQRSIEAGVTLLAEDRKAEGIIPTMSVRDNVALMAMPELSRWGFIRRRRVNDVVDRFVDELSIRCAGAGQPISSLSGGNQQKALLARLLAVEPTIMLLDEPTRGIDIGAKAEVQRLIQELADDGRGIVLVSSELEDIIEGANRVVVLKNGRIVREVGGDDISEHNLIRLMAGEETVA
jgi:ribose transport system ATP-binding protein